jgi:hypothetical protein
MSNTTTSARLIAIRDKLLDAIDKLAGEGVSSYTIGDQTYTLRDIDDMLKQVDSLDKRIAIKDMTLGGAKGRNRIDMRRFHQ